jgi:hypothetical protein
MQVGMPEKERSNPFWRREIGSIIPGHGKEGESCHIKTIRPIRTSKPSAGLWTNAGTREASTRYPNSPRTIITRESV